MKWKDIAKFLEREPGLLVCIKRNLTTADVIVTKRHFPIRQDTSAMSSKTGCVLTGEASSLTALVDQNAFSFENKNTTYLI